MVNTLKGSIIDCSGNLNTTFLSALIAIPGSTLAITRPTSTVTLSSVTSPFSPTTTNLNVYTPFKSIGSSAGCQGRCSQFFKPVFQVARFPRRSTSPCIMPMSIGILASVWGIFEVSMVTHSSGLRPSPYSTRYSLNPFP